MNKEEIISKVKKLLNLANSSNPNEATTAKSLADKLIEKYQLAPEDYELGSDEPIYSDNDLLFEINSFVDWKARLALAVAKKYHSFIIQEQNVVNTGEIFYKYFIYGDPVDAVYVKQVFDLLNKQIEEKLAQFCKEKEELYVSSFCEGLMTGVLFNLEYEDIELIGLAPPQEKKNELSSDKQAVVKVEAKKEAPIKERTQVNKKENDIDPMAYYKGVKEGYKIHLDPSSKDKLLIF